MRFEGDYYNLSCIIMGISVSESQAQKQRIEQLNLKKAKAYTNSEIRSEQKKPFEEMHGEDHEISGVTNIRASNHRHQIKKQLNQSKDIHSQEGTRLKNIKIQQGKNQEVHPTENKIQNKNKWQSIKQLQTIEHINPTHSKANNNEAYHKSIKNASPSHEKRVSFVEPQSKREKVQDRKQLSKEISKTSVINRRSIESKQILNNQASRAYMRVSNEAHKQIPVNKSINNSQSPNNKRIQSKDEDLFNISKEQLEHSRIVNNGSKTLTATRNHLRLQKDPQDVGRADDMEFQNFDWKIPKSTINKVIPSHKKLKPQASVVLISKMGKQQDNQGEQAKKSNWKNRRELMNEIVSGRLDSAQTGFSLGQCMPNLKDSDIYKKACS